MRCSCGSWQLSGIPCSHAILCLYHLKKSRSDYVNDCYKKSTFLATYSHVLNPIDWYTTIGMPLQPPPYIKLAGRPKKLRKKDKNEIVKKGKTERLKKWVIFHYGWCRKTCHNIRRCPTKVQERAKAKRGETSSVADYVEGAADPVVGDADPVQ
ncbi:hypothetical protein LIER_43160 [Lithospermum erythrorhizon]|uniref:SWIM-type domain-containing protein n=1 Tax=Lithospermum erythrorhizon TaxID=34254 RepID=A0AAV3PK27_LITER